MVTTPYVSNTQTGPVTRAIAAMRNDEPVPPRRAFLRGLVTLPLIGGGVTLIGKPTQAAEAASIPCAENYAAWLHYEQRALQAFLYPGFDSGFIPQSCPGASYHFDDRFGHDGWWQRVGQEAMARAPVILATVGCDWREGVR